MIHSRLEFHVHETEGGLAEIFIKRDDKDPSPFSQPDQLATKLIALVSKGPDAVGVPRRLLLMFDHTFVPQIIPLLEENPKVCLLAFASCHAAFVCNRLGFL